LEILVLLLNLNLILKKGKLFVELQITLLLKLFKVKVIPMKSTSGHLELLCMLYCSEDLHLKQTMLKKLTKESNNASIRLMTMPMYHTTPETSYREF